jgi:hypothetical protein
MAQDAQGHQLSGATAAVVATYDEAVRAFNLVHGDAIGLFDEARQAAPDFSMAHLGKAWVFTVANDPVLRTQAEALVEIAELLPLNEREQAHLIALSHLCRGARVAAVAVLDRHLMRYPFDLVAHQGAALTDGFLGRFHWVRDRTARALPFWSKDQPGYGTLLALHAFGLEEAGDYARAEDESRAAAELEPLSFWPHHTVAHVMEMTGRPEDGLGSSNRGSFCKPFLRSGSYAGFRVVFAVGTGPLHNGSSSADLPRWTTHSCFIERCIPSSGIVRPTSRQGRLLKRSTERLCVTTSRRARRPCGRIGCRSKAQLAPAITPCVTRPAFWRLHAR